MQKRLGITYKDAAHRLFMAELEKLKVEEQMVKSYANLRARVEMSIAACQEDLAIEDEQANANDGV